MAYFVIENKMYQNPYYRVEKRVVGLGEGIENELDSKLGAGIQLEIELKVDVGGPDRTEDVCGEALETFYPAVELDKHLK